MFEGRLAAIYVTEKKRGQPALVHEAEVVAGRGLVGDRYYQQQGTFTKPGEPDREVTLIEAEAVEALERETKLKLEPGESRRNLITRGVPLNHLVGRTFRVGAVVLEGLRLCEPCTHLESLTLKGVKDGLCHRGGLRARIIEGGVIRVNDGVRPFEDGPQ